MVAAVRPETRWVTRLIPLFLAGCVGFSTYVFIKRICGMQLPLSPRVFSLWTVADTAFSLVDYYIDSQNQPRTATVFLAIYFVFLLLMLLTYFRLFLIVQHNPGVLPLGPLAAEQKEREKERRKKNRKRFGTCAHSRDDLEANRYEGYWPDPNVDSPGLERFYSKDIFVCHTDGRPRWCSACCNWKQDRASHCSEINRCVKKMDHYCPWVGGIVGETCKSEAQYLERPLDKADTGISIQILRAVYILYRPILCYRPHCRRSLSEVAGPERSSFGRVRHWCPNNCWVLWHLYFCDDGDSRPIYLCQSHQRRLCQGEDPCPPTRNSGASRHFTWFRLWCCYISAAEGGSIELNTTIIRPDGYCRARYPERPSRDTDLCDREDRKGRESMGPRSLPQLAVGHGKQHT